MDQINDWLSLGERLYPFIAELAVVFAAAWAFYRKTVRPLHIRLTRTMDFVESDLPVKIQGLLEMQDDNTNFQRKTEERLSRIETKLGIEHPDNVHAGSMF